MAQTLGRLALVAGAIALLGMFAGWGFAKGQPRAAAGAVIADFVEVTNSAGNGEAPADNDVVAPASGDHLGSVRCGVQDEPISNDDHLASLAKGVIVLRHGPDLAAAEVARLEAFTRERDATLLAPEPRLEVPLVAMSWSHRMPLPEANLELLAAFHTALVGIAPDAADQPCPAGSS